MNPLLQCPEHIATLLGILAKNAQPDTTDEETSDKVQTDRYSTKLSSQRKTGIFPGKVVKDTGCLYVIPGLLYLGVTLFAGTVAPKNVVTSVLFPNGWKI